jgi:hypothetical protein
LGTAKQPVERVDRDRQELDVDGLEVRDPAQAVAVEGQQHPPQHGCPPVPGPSPHDERHRPACQREPGDDEQVVHDRRREAGPQQRRAERPLKREVLGERQRVRLGIEDVGVEQPQRIANDLVSKPADAHSFSSASALSCRVSVAGAEARGQV